MDLSPTQRQIVRLSGAMRLVIPAIGFAALFAPVIYWWAGVYNVADNTLVLAATPPREGFAWFGWLVGLPSTACWLYALYRLWRFFSVLQRERFINRDAAVDLKFFSFFTIAAVIFDVLTSGARRWAQGEFDNAPLYTHINLNSEHATLVFVAMMFFTVALVLEEAHRFKDETEQYL